MDTDNLLIICRVCARKILMHNMRPDDDGEHMICNECYAKKAGVKGAQSIFGKTSVSNTPDELPKRKPTVEKAEKMVKYICTKCKYKFSRKASQHVEKCPYCGKNSIVVDSALGAEKLLDDSVDKKFDW